MFRLAGFKVGAGTLMGQVPLITGTADKDFFKRLVIGERVYINIGCIFDLGDKIEIGNDIRIGHEVLIITVTHKIGDNRCRAGKKTTKPVVIQDGVWLGARCVIHPGVTVGKGSIVAAGAVVVSDVEPNTIVGGVPAKVIRHLPGENEIHDSAATLVPKASYVEP